MLRKLFSFTTLFLFVQLIHAQAPAVEWQNMMGGVDHDYFWGSAMLPNGHVMLGGYSSSSGSGDVTEVSNGSTDYLLIEIDQSGTIISSNLIGGSGFDGYPDMVFDSTLGLVVCGAADSGISGDVTVPGYGSSDIWIALLNASGTVVDQLRLGGSTFELYAVTEATANHHILAGATSQSGISGTKTEAHIGSGDFWVSRVNTSGTVLWDRTLGGADIERLTEIEEASDGSIFVGGYSHSGISGNKTVSSFGGRDVWIVKLDASGNILWDLAYGGNQNEELDAMIPTADGGAILGISSFSGVSGNKTVPSNGLSDIWIVKIDANGTIEWQQSVGGNYYDKPHHMLFNAEGDLIVSGSSTSFNTGDWTAPYYGNDDMIVARIDNTGNVVWDARVGGTDADRAYDIYQTDDFGYLVVGDSRSALNGNLTEGTNGDTDFFAFKLASDCTTVYYEDSDNDGFGDPNSTVIDCVVPAGYVTNSDDCDDTNGSIFPGALCSDGDLCTANDVIDENCNCVGEAVICDDGDPCTIDTCDPVLGCVFTAVPDSDGDGICDVLDECPSLFGQIGDPCDDGDPCTDNDTIDAGCNCVGTPGPDSDGDGFCDAIDPVNDGNFCSGAIDLNVGISCMMQTFSTVGLSNSGTPSPSCGFYQGTDMWFSFEVPASGQFRVEVEGESGYNAQFAVYLNCINELRCDQLTDNENFNNPELAGQTLYVRVWRYNNASAGEFDICIWETAAPVNDFCDDSINLPVGATCNPQIFSNQFATSESYVPSPGCGFFYDGDVWFNFEVPASGQFRIDINDISTNPQFALYQGGCGVLSLYDCDQLTNNQTYNDPSVAGETMLIRVWSYANENGGEFDLCVWEPPIPANDNCVDAIVVPVESSCNLVTYSTEHATNQNGLVSDPGCGFYNGNDVWFEYTVPASGQFRIEAHNITTNAQFAIYQGDCLGMTEYYCDQLTDNEVFNDPALAGETMLLRVFTYGSEDGGEFELCIWEAPVPPNDNCEDAIDIPVGTSCNMETYTNEHSTDQNSLAPSPTCGFYNGSDVWFTVEVPSSGHLRIELSPETGTVPAFSLYQGTCGAFNELQCAQLSNFINVHDETLAGQTLYLRVFSYGSEDGKAFDICAWEPNTADNDFCEEAFELPVGADCQFLTFDNLGCTPETDLPSGGCLGSNYYSSMWFTVEVPANGELFIDMNSGSLNHPNMSIYQGTCGALTYYGCSDGGSVNGALVAYYEINDIALAGETLYILAYGRANRDGGTFDICASSTCITPDTWYADTDGDGYGDPNMPFEACFQNPGYVMNSDDCNDSDPSIFLNAVCDDLDPLTVNDAIDANCDCVGELLGCTDPTACNYNMDADVDDGSCVYLLCSDDDMDGLTYEEEMNLGTDPNNPDSDLDGLNDGEEVLSTGTDPLVQDSDYDGLTDYLEVYESLTNPNVADTDGDTCDDAYEYSGQCPDNCTADINNDGIINTGDLTNLLGQFGTTCE